MKRNTLFAAVITFLILLCSASAFAQRVIYEEHFTGGETDLDWNSVWFDPTGAPLTPMETDSVPINPSGDGWIGTLATDTLYLGGFGLTYAGDDTLADYTMEAQIWVDVDDDSYYEGIMIRTHIDTVISDPDTVIRAQGYQLVSNFYPPFFIERVKFRKYSSFPDDIKDLRVYDSSEIPGGAPTESGWHKFKIEAMGDFFWLYWDDMEFPGNPQVDTTSTPLLTGKFGVYIFNFGYAEVGCDDIIISTDDTGIGDGPGEIGIPKAFGLSQNYPNPFNPMTTIRVDIPDGDLLPVTLDIFDLRGRRVRALVDKTLSGGAHFFAWDGRGDSGERVPSGTYLYRLTRGTEVSTKKMIMTK